MRNPWHWGHFVVGYSTALAVLSPWDSTRFASFFMASDIPLAHWPGLWSKPLHKSAMVQFFCVVAHDGDKLSTWLVHGESYPVRCL
jgi:hypothetical protein